MLDQYSFDHLLMSIFRVSSGYLRGIFGIKECDFHVPNKTRKYKLSTKICEYAKFLLPLRDFCKNIYK